MRLSPGGGRGDATGHFPPPGLAMFLSLVALVSSDWPWCHRFFHTPHRGFFLPSCPASHAATVDVLVDFLHICHLLVVVLYVLPQTSQGKFPPPAPVLSSCLVPPLSRRREGVNACAFLETILTVVNSHRDHFVCVNISAVITCQGNIPELGHNGCVFLNFSR